MDPRPQPARPEHLLEHAGWVRALARALCRDEHAAADLEQETWLAALRGGAHARDARAWLGSVARRLAASSGRSEGRRSAREADVAGSRPPESPDAAETLASVELSARLARAVAELEEPYRTTLALRYYEGQSPRHIAQRLGIDARAVESRLRRGREQLREALDRGCGGREVWFAPALALAFAGSEGAGRSISLAALLALLLGGGVAGGIALRRAWTEPEVQPRAAVELRALHPPAETAPAAPPAALAPVETARLAVAAPAAGVELVVAGEGTPIAGARVTLTGREGRREAISDSGGRADFGAILDELAVEVAVEATERTCKTSARVAAARRTRVEVPRRGGRIVGTVVDGEGRPMPASRVFAWANPARRVDPQRPDRTAIADGRGAFALDDMAGAWGDRQAWGLAARAGEACTFAMLEGQVDPSASGIEVTLVVEPAWTLRGRVTDPAGRPLQGVTLLAYHAQRPEAGTWASAPWKASTRTKMQTVSDSLGRFELQVVAPDESFQSGWRLQAESPRHRTTWVDVSEPGWIDLVLEWGGRLEGVVLDAEMRPVQGAKVVLHAYEQRQPTSTDESGRFGFEGLTELEGALLAVTAEGHALSVTAVDLELAGASQRIVLEPACRLSGVAIEAEGVPIPYAQVTFEGDRTLATAWLPRSRGWMWEVLGTGQQAWCDGAGRFAVEGLYPGRWVVRLRGSGGVVLASAQTRLGADAGKAVELRAGTGLDALVTIRGQVLDEAGVPVEGAGIDARRFLEGETESTLEFGGNGSTSGPDGRFEIRGLSPGRWTVGASSWASGEHRGTPASEPRVYAAGVHEVELRFAERPSR
jgi:RNA polymerase sigma factor (sigma-70 family)